MGNATFGSCMEMKGETSALLLEVYGYEVASVVDLSKRMDLNGLGQNA